MDKDNNKRKTIIIKIALIILFISNMIMIIDSEIIQRFINIEWSETKILLYMLKHYYGIIIFDFCIYGIFLYHYYRYKKNK